MVKVAPAHSSPHGHPPEEACSPARGCPLEDPSPRGCRAEAAPVPADSRRFPPPLPVQEGPGVERSTFLEARLVAVAGAALQEAAGTRGAQPLPRVLEPATSKAAHFPALEPLSVSYGDLPQH
eukprot:scaffold54443_cov88-Phaeocystis_antarctica.AAC.1